MPDDHSKLVPLLPISNRKVKRLSADDSADSRVKVGHCQALIQKTPTRKSGRFSLSDERHFFFKVEQSQRFELRCLYF
jgi:hypothetical protein